MWVYAEWLFVRSTWFVFCPCQFFCQNGLFSESALAEKRDGYIRKDLCPARQKKYKPYCLEFKTEAVNI